MKIITQILVASYGVIVLCQLLRLYIMAECSAPKRNVETFGKVMLHIQVPSNSKRLWYLKS